MDLQKLHIAIELHDAERIRKILSELENIEEGYEGKPWIELLIAEYTRSPKFKECALAFVECGDQIGDKFLEAVLTDNSTLLSEQLALEPEGVVREYTFSSAYTPFLEVSLMHLCAEFNHVACAEVLIQQGLSIDTPAGLDSLGFGGQTPIFHTVNQNGNQSWEMLDFCLKNQASLDIQLKGLIWGKDKPWETFLPDVSPVSYAMMGLLPQMHRNEKTVAETVELLMKHKYGMEYKLPNIPNAYLKT